MNTDILIIGAGPAGIGMGIVLKQMECNFIIVDRGRIAESFYRWPPETRMISPSFTGNYFGAVDLNAVCPDTSPGFSVETEHPSGKQYATYLNMVASAYSLPILESTNVTSIAKEDDLFQVDTSRGPIHARYVIWAAGEYQFPRTEVCEGHHHGIHTTQIEPHHLDAAEIFPIIGGYESGFDTAFYLAKNGKKSVIFDTKNRMEESRSDASFSLSPFTKDRFRRYSDFIRIRPHTRVESIQKQGDHYVLSTNTDETFAFHAPPFLATGFETSLSLIPSLFEHVDGSVTLTPVDESTKVPGLFLAGPQVNHAGTIFCFIYKFRQRFAVVAEEITTRLGLAGTDPVKKTLHRYKDKSFYLKDLSCCGDECIC